MKIDEFIERSNKLKQEAKRHSEECNLALMGQDMVENTELLEEIASYRSDALIALNDTKEEFRQKRTELQKQLEELKAEYSTKITTQNNNLITIKSEFASLKSLQNLLKMQCSNVKHGG